MFKIKTGYYLVPLTPEKLELLGITKSKIIKVQNGKKVPYLQITEVVLTHCNVVKSNYQQSSIVFYILDAVLKI